MLEGLELAKSVKVEYRAQEKAVGSHLGIFGYAKRVQHSPKRCMSSHKRAFVVHLGLVSDQNVENKPLSG